MKALTIRQPWATLLAIEAKAVETRSWQTKYRGPVLIHAGAGHTRAERELEEMEPFFAALGGHDDGQERIATPLPRGQVLAVADLVDVIPTTTLDELMQKHRRPCVQVNHPDHVPGYKRLPANERLFGDYAPGRFGWIFDHVQRLDNPVPASGALSLWTPPTDVLMPTLAQVEGYAMPGANT